ncbi:MAG: hypothetical protein IJ318_00510, partial [Clostridia bacterium]|nr:hypothetical protein [Clostridia bacterium]
SAYPIVASMGAVTKPSNVKVTGSDPIKLETGAQNIEFTITLSLEKTGDAYNKIDMPASDDNLTITMVFSKYIAPEFTVNDDGELVTTMGHGTDADYAYAGVTSYEEEIEWFAFAVKGEDLSEDQDAYKITVGTDTWYSLAGVNMTGKTLTGKTFWFIQRYVTAGGYFGDPNDTEYDYSWITSQQFNESSSDGNDYDQSDIHEYLSGYAYQAATGITSGMLYDITKREVNETYPVNYADDAQENAFSSRLWLLSKKEVGLLNGAEVSNGNTYSEPVKAYGIGNTAGDADGYGAGWWLRSPDPADADSAFYVSAGSNLYSTFVADLNGVRAAFEISIS